MENGIIINNKHVCVEVRAIIADAPAKAFLKQIKSHSGYFSCDRCVVKGEHNQKSVSFGNLKCDKRTDTSFREKSQPEHHVGTSPFVSLNINIINVFVYDYMHLILLGIVRKLVNLYLREIPYKMSTTQKHLVENRIKIIAKYFPSDFNRKPRSFSEFDRFKATELRSILLYTGIILFEDVLPVHLYNNFLILMYLTRIFCDKKAVTDPEMVDYAERLCVTFVKQFKKIFPTVNVSYNVHSLIHIAADVRRLGPLDSFSAFPFENCLGHLKRRVRSSNNPLAQICRRISEGYNFQHKMPEIRKDVLSIDGHKVDCKHFKDSCVLLKDKSVAIVQKIVGNTLTVDNCKKIGPVSKYPMDSEFIDIFIVKKKNNQSNINSNDVLCKCTIFPYKQNFLISPLL